MKFLRSKPEPVPTELDLQLVEALEAVTECAETHAVCEPATKESRKVLKRAKSELGLRS